MLRPLTGIGIINKTMAAIAVVLILVMMLITTADVGGRYLLASPIPGTTEITRLLLVFSVAFALGYTELMQQHVRMELVLTRLTPKRRTLIETLVLVLALVFIGLATYAASVVAHTSTIRGEYETGLIDIPMWPGRIALALGCLMLGLQYVVGIIKGFRSYSQIE